MTAENHHPAAGPGRQRVLDVAGGVLLLGLLYLVALVVRRRVLARHGGTIELSHRRAGTADGEGWMLGTGRYSGEHLEWFRVFSLSPRPRRRWRRDELTFDGRREPHGSEQVALYPDHLVIRCSVAGGDEIDLAMSASSLTGFQAWLESRPPGTDWDQ